MPLNTKIPKLALPLILSNISVPLLGLSNTIIAGHLSDSTYLAVMGLGTMIFNFLYWGLGFLRMSTTGLMAQQHGAKDQEAICNTLLHSVSLALIIGLLIICSQQAIYFVATRFIHSGPQTQHLIAQYYYTRVWAAPAVLLSLVMVGAMIAIQETKGPLLLLSITNGLAILLSVIAVFALHLNLQGIALADVIAQYIGLIVGIYILAKHFDLRHIWQNTQLQTTKLIQLLHTNRDIFIRTLCLISVFTFFTIWSSHISMLVLAVNTLLMNFFQITSNALGGFDNVAEALAGEAVGRKDFRAFKQAIIDVGRWVILFSLGLSALFLVFGHPLINLISDIASVRTAAYPYIPYVALLPIIAFASFLLDGVAIGANLFREMRNSMLLTVVLSACVWFALRNLNNLGLWLAFFSFFIFRAIFLAYYCKRFYHKNTVSGK